MTGLPTTEGLSPMMSHYVETKHLHPNGLLFYRVGDFFELFFDDAVSAGKLLGLTCTSRQVHQGQAIPMAGVPHHALEGYVDQALDQGLPVVVVDQVEDPAQAKGIVKRAVTRIETPGTVIREDDPDPIFIAALAPPTKRKERCGFAVMDLGSADFRCTSFDTVAEGIEELRRLGVRELLLPEGEEQLAQTFDGAQVELEKGWFARRGAPSHLKGFLRVKDLAAFGLAGHKDRLAAAAALARYVQATRTDAIEFVTRLRNYERVDRLHLDASTLRNLEIFSTLSGERRGSLFHAVDRTCTAGGKRALIEALRAPLRDRQIIEDRLNRTQAMVANDDLRAQVRDELDAVVDLERLASRLALGGGNPRQLRQLASSLVAMPSLAQRLSPDPVLGTWFSEVWRLVAGEAQGDGLLALGQLLDRALEERPPVRRGDSDSIAPGYDEELDAARNLARHGAEAIASFQQRQRQETGIPTLKVKQNKVFGYFIEVSTRYLDKAPERYRRKQTISTGERFIDDELASLADAIERALHASDQREEQLVAALRDRASQHVDQLFEIAGRLSELDLAQSFGQLAVTDSYTRPELTDASDQMIDLRACRHPVVEQLSAEAFVPNDLCIGTGSERLIVLTGPNMGGKSTVMRQAALAVILAQAGSFVPASTAKLALRDRIFTRVGASDDLAQGRSTFMVEMTETANILHHATAESLVILDEIGRGTATFDGLSLAWAVAEDLVDRVGCLGLFATHYHELCELAETRETVINMRLAVREWNHEIHFLRQLEPGGASRSYGIQVARLAGLPSDVVGRSQEILHQLELRERDRSDRPTLLPPQPGSAGQMNLFGVSPADAKAADDLAEIEALLRRTDPDHTTPIEAHRLLIRVRKKLL
jgi:DNA mismatch repair protein MutS